MDSRFCASSFLAGVALTRVLLAVAVLALGCAGDDAQPPRLACPDRREKRRRKDVDEIKMKKLA